MKINKTHRKERCAVNPRTSEHSGVELSIPERSGVGSEEIKTQEHHLSTQNIKLKAINYQQRHHKEHFFHSRTEIYNLFCS